MSSKYSTKSETLHLFRAYKQVVTMKNLLRYYLDSISMDKFICWKIRTEQLQIWQVNSLFMQNVQWGKA